MALSNFNPRALLPTPVFTKKDLEHESLPEVNQYLVQVSQALNYLLGHAGPIKLNNSLDLGGNPIQNAGVPSNPNDVVNLEFALKNYSAEALRPNIEALGKQVLSSMRRLNDTIQRENYSSFLNGVLNTAPTANTATVSATTPVGGSCTVTVSAGFHQRVDGSQVPFSLRSDTFLLPIAFSYTSATRTAGRVTVVTPAPSGVTGGQAIALGGASNSSFNGFFVVDKVDSPTQFEYIQGGVDASTSGGGYTPVNVYYYTISKGQTTLNLVPAAGADSWSNRVAASNDGTTLVAVVALDVNGLEIVNSAAGATSPQAGGNVPVVRRI